MNIIPSEAYNDSLQTYISFPKPYKEHEFNQSIGVSVTVLPRSVFEDAYSQLPMIYYKARYGLPYNFSANGRFNTVIFTNQASIGLMWSYNFNDYYIAAAYEWGQWFGFMESEGLSIKSRGSLNYPSISLGHQFDKVRLTLKGELMIQTQKTAVDGLAIGQSFNGISGYAISAIIEQPLWKNHTVLGEIKLNFNKFHYQTWLSYSTFNSFILYPEIIFGFNL
ncbi:MAG: hypothetical protein NT007_14135 [Candidatus Kapabacteria bacterium]|nr:hypothetical protein [Candidatus Kapabacteria bacterium]